MREKVWNWRGKGDVLQPLPMWPARQNAWNINDHATPLRSVHFLVTGCCGMPTIYLICKIIFNKLDKTSYFKLHNRDLSSGPCRQTLAAIQRLPRPQRLPSLAISARHSIIKPTITATLIGIAQKDWSLACGFACERARAIDTNIFYKGENSLETGFLQGLWFEPVPQFS